MKLSWQDQYTLWQELCSDADAANLSMGKTLIRLGQRKLEALLSLTYTEEERTFTTVTDTIAGTSNQDYKLPENFVKLTNIYVTVGTTDYQAELIQDEELWRQINSTTSQSTSDYLQFCFIRRDRVSLYPIPSSAQTATIRYEAHTKPLNQDNYITGTVSALANGATAVTGVLSVWTAAMIGRYFKINDDNEWYKIASRTSDLAIGLDSNYQGVTISGGTESYTIGQMPITPDDTHELPVYYAAWKWALFRKDTQLAREYERMWKEGIKDAEAANANLSASNIIKARPGLRRRLPFNPNLYPENMT